MLTSHTSGTLRQRLNLIIEYALSLVHSHLRASDAGRKRNLTILGTCPFQTNTSRITKLSTKKETVMGLFFCACSPGVPYQ